VELDAVLNHLVGGEHQSVSLELPRVDPFGPDFANYQSAWLDVPVEYQAFALLQHLLLWLALSTGKIDAYVKVS